MLDPILKVTVLLALVAMAAHLLRKHSAALRHMVWTFGIIAMVLIPLLASTVPFKLRVIPASTLSVSSGEATLPPPASAETGKEKSQPEKTIAANESAAPTASLASEPTSAPLDLGRALLLVWALGVAYLTLRYSIGVIRVRGIARRATTVTDEAWLQIADRAGRLLGVSEPVDVRRSAEVAMPFACGLKNPVIVLPAVADEWTQERREAVMMHEFAHISRGDLAMNTLSHVTRALYWFHPLAWLASYRLRVEGERACDDAVLRAGALPSDYAEHLLSIVRSVGNTVPNVALAMARRSDFEGRLLAILEPGVPRGTLSRLRAAGLAALFVVAVMPLSAMAPKLPASMAEAESELAQLAHVETKTHEVASAKTTKSTVTMQSQSPSASRQEQGTLSPAVGALIETLSDANAGVRVVAAQSLGQIQDPRAITALSKALKEDTDARVRQAAAEALGEIDDNRAVPALVDALKVEKIASVRRAIVEALGEIDDPSAASAIGAFAKDADAQVRRAVASALGELEDPIGVPALVSMARDEDAEVRKEVAESLGEIEHANAIDALSILAKDSDPEVRSHAISSLGNLEDMRTLGTLVAALKDENADVRNQAADAIGNIDGLRTAPPALIEALRDPHRDVRSNAASALGDIGDVAAVPALKRAVADTDTDVRRNVVEALKEIGGAEALEALVALLKDPDPEIRKTAAEALGKRR